MMKRFSRIDLGLWLAFFLIALWMRSFELNSTLDQRLYYSAAEAQLYLNSMSVEMAGRYAKNEFVDLLFIVVYSALLFRRLQHPVAFLPGVFDLLETGTILLCLGGILNPGQASWLGTATLLKWVAGAWVALRILIPVVLRIRLPRG